LFRRAGAGQLGVPLPSLAARIRSLTGEEITRLMEYERTHADRPLAIRTMEYRRDELASGAEPTAGDRPV
jgi:hypothetical protein